MHHRHALVLGAVCVLALVTAGCSGGATSGQNGSTPAVASGAGSPNPSSSPASGTPNPHASAGAPGSSSPTPSASPAVPASEDERSCLWAVDTTNVNTLFPDTNAIYYVAVLPIPPGGDIRFTGPFAHARYVSFNVYNPILQPTDALTDDEIVPNAGSTNPFLAGANRNAAARSFSLKMVQQTAPTGTRPPNMLYAGQTIATLAASQNEAVVIYRVYVPDMGLDDTGGVGLPNIVFDYANGQSLTGLPLCNAVASLDDTLPNLNTVPDPVQNLSLPAPTQTYLAWQKFFDTEAAEAYRVAGLPGGFAVYEGVDTAGGSSGGFASNADNRYIYADISQAFGNVVALHARMPVTPKTYGREATMGSGDMRYLSICSNDENLTTVFACLYDEQIPQDAQGNAVIAVSMPADRPANATAACGVAWLDWGTDDQSLLIFRNMLPLPQTQFPEAIQYIPAPPGYNETSVMGAYYPYGEHMQKAAFEALGCPVSAAELPSIAPSPTPT
jgi:hypothetical protein